MLSAGSCRAFFGGGVFRELLEFLDSLLDLIILAGNVLAQLVHVDQKSLQLLLQRVSPGLKLYGFSP